MPTKPMYSGAWFDTFAARVPASVTAAEVAAITRLAPPLVYPRLLDVGCGTGRVAAPLAAEGYHVTAIDTSVEALRAVRRTSLAIRCVALDQRHVGRLRWTFDVAIVLWNSLGFGGAAADRTTLCGLHRVLRSSGRLLLDLYHPGWLAANKQAGTSDAGGVRIDRWLEDGRSCHEIRYAEGSVDRIHFNVYGPEEIERLLREAGFRVDEFLVWWKPDATPGPDYARYQVVSTALDLARD